MQPDTFLISSDHVGATLAAFLRAHCPGLTWNQVRNLVHARHVRIGGDLCCDPARRLREGDVVQISKRSAPPSRAPELLVLRHLDAQLVVVEKPSGMCTVRFITERNWSERRKALHPTLEDLLPPMIARAEHRKQRGPRLRAVHRLDKETSGLVVFARTVPAERELGRQFAAHSVVRRYLAIVPGRLTPQTIDTHLIRDRGDGRRGSTTLQGLGKRAVTHIEVEEALPGYSLVSCRLETGRTHQIRIHLAELGHPVCGDRVYRRSRSGATIEDPSNAPRLALHACELGFVHPGTEQSMHWSMPLPKDLSIFVDRLRGQTP